MSAPRARALRIAGNVMAVAGVAFVVVKLRSSLAALPALTIDAPLLGVVVLGVVVNIVALALATSSWRALLRGVGVDARWRVCATIVGRSNIAKYVPGNIFHLVGRVGLAAAAGLPSALVVATLAAETALIVGVAGLLGAASASVRLQHLTQVPTPLVVVVAVVVAVGVLVALALALRRRGITLTLRTTSTVVALNVVSCVVQGSAMWLVLQQLSTTSTPWWWCVSGFSLAWVLGFVTPGAPGGVGVREAVFVALVDSDTAGVVAAAVIIGRVQSVLADVIVFALAQLAAQGFVATSR